MKKFFIVISVFLVLTIVKACIFRVSYYDIVDVDFRALGHLNIEGETVIEDGLQFEVSYILEGQQATHKAYIYLPSLVRECHALTLPREIGNYLLWDSFSLSFDKPFIFRNQTISAGTNILEITDIKDECMIYEHKKDESSIYDRSAKIDFSKGFIENSVFTGSYKVEFSCETSDERYFRKYTTIVFDSAKQ